ncbi:alpha/beta hydrolase [Iamia sp. SCSIO 61187]|uniref:alpha/beta hydrolase n=1 Tax=Iamia sp. SCSIO 61187 TaxID=2722752 RepID=UPI001C634126|nr:alpha/beta hydrolase [Iamia sp. SCSIO 61187]QYG93660.1 alpha/beta hydrolase [Iamia sp. SCSIO 61187]
MVPRRIAPVLALALVAVTLASSSAPPAAGAGRRYLDRVFPEVTVTRDITYGAAPDETGTTQTLELDLYEPAGDTAMARPLIVLAHGGSWVMGSKQSMAVLATAYARRGFVAASVEYRMDEAAVAIGYPPPPTEVDRVVAAKHDVQAAVRWLRAHAASHRVDPDAIAVGGISAGAVTAVSWPRRPTIPVPAGHRDPRRGCAPPSP